MPFQKGRPKTGGRKQGSPHTKITRDVIALLDELQCNPIEGLSRIALDEKVAIEVRAKCYSELAKYIHPQRKAVEHSGTIRAEHGLAPGAIFQRVCMELAKTDSEDRTGTDALETESRGTSESRTRMALLTGQTESDSSRDTESGKSA